MIIDYYDNILITSNNNPSELYQISTNNINNIINSGNENDKMTASNIVTSLTNASTTLGYNTGVIDPTGTYAYVATQNVTNTSLTINKINLSDLPPASVASYTISTTAGVDSYVSLMDPSGNYVYFITYVTSGTGFLYKLPISTFGTSTNVTSYSSTSLLNIKSGVITSDGSYAILFLVLHF